jgi:hypothetical protein
MGQALRQRLHERDSLLKELEAQAEQIEVTIWQELVASQRARGKNPGPRKKAAAPQATIAVK